MNGIDYQIQMEITIQPNMRQGEVQSKFPKKKGTTVKRRLKILVKSGVLTYEKIKGLHPSSKVKRYNIAEENTTDDLWTVVSDKKTWKRRKIHFTQKSLSADINEKIKNWRKGIGNRKKTEEQLIRFDVAYLISCMEWITKLTWAINSGMFGDSKTQYAIANRNRLRYDEFIQKIVYHMRDKYPENYPQIRTLVYDVLDKHPLLSKFNV